MFKFGEEIGEEHVKDIIPVAVAIVSIIIGFSLIVCVFIARHELNGGLSASVISLVAISLFSISPRRAFKGILADTSDCRKISR
ncbi:hypothetical protein SAMN04488032_109149 [Pacificibacter marinus]|uniref:Uncharacterized protein n=1 Tax=Pacificibacter marinus TaxID=658057 RepID=A0A1Y5T6R7_9RHOB|nr:hypothetical protein SAMN04488032_109149 [Pacificibacter marinus]SLN55035.1 hypothetical protein PAM7971_02840 [Pacificibacter marinus]